jgi:hypothetical protein
MSAQVEAGAHKKFGVIDSSFFTDTRSKLRIKQSGNKFVKRNLLQDALQFGREIVQSGTGESSDDDPVMASEMKESEPDFRQWQEETEKRIQKDVEKKMATMRQSNNEFFGTLTAYIMRAIYRRQEWRHHEDNLQHLVF